MALLTNGLLSFKTATRCRNRQTLDVHDDYYFPRFGRWHTHSICFNFPSCWNFPPYDGSNRNTHNFRIADNWIEHKFPRFFLHLIWPLFFSKSSIYTSVVTSSYHCTSEWYTFILFFCSVLFTTGYHCFWWFDFVTTLLQAACLNFLLLFRHIELSFMLILYYRLMGFQPWVIKINSNRK